MVQSVQYIAIVPHSKLQAAVPLFVNQYSARNTHAQNNNGISLSVNVKRMLTSLIKQHFEKRSDILYIC